jgi:hypothetical protein
MMLIAKIVSHSESHSRGQLREMGEGSRGEVSLFQGN